MSLKKVLIAVLGASACVALGPTQATPSGGPIIANGGQRVPAAPRAEKLGTVRFATSCNAAAELPFSRAVALLHSFEFRAAIESFSTTLEADPSCAIAEWGIALSRWGNPFGIGVRPAAVLLQGLEAVERAELLGTATDRERAYIEAVSFLYVDAVEKSQLSRMVAYRDAMERLAAAYPADREASIFHALSISAVAASSPLDRTYAEPLKAGAILEKLATEQPDHPGIAHYIIHAYDYPPLAPRALAAARRYAKIAPSVPHALHMPSHTFTRLGYWQESIEANVTAGAAAKREGATAEELHTLDYRTYAYLQMGENEAARIIVEALPEVAARLNPDALGSAAPRSTGVFALAAIPARYALERGAWSEAARLEPRASSYPYSEALTYFARALGAARSGDAPLARTAAESLRQIHERLAAAGETYWAEQVDFQWQTASAWIAFAEGRKSAALEQLRVAAQAEDGTEKAAITPGPLAPARELLGEMLLELGEPTQALEQFEATLKKEPNRFRAVHGAARAAAEAGDSRNARRLYQQLLNIAGQTGQPGRPELTEARKYLGKL